MRQQTWSYKTWIHDHALMTIIDLQLLISNQVFVRAYRVQRSKICHLCKMQKTAILFTAMDQYVDYV